ncbi:hypothetical protein M9H77_04204 [Catharanthus roseus]|uniref:Uncharacterized protein n=1 Tax=Catharanthus roseus TaxID=4058 RepID=A0ACC0CDW3_CATRO|nr:hypothetical protein M9H77_04204 [Catharanthus roseus]
MRAWRFIFLLLGGHMLPDMSGSLIHTFMLQKVDDMTIGVLKRPPSFPTQHASVMRKAQTIIRRCMVSIGAAFEYKSRNNDNQMCYLRIIRHDISKEGIHIPVEFELIQPQTLLEAQHTHVSTDENHSNIHQHVTEITQIISDEPSMFYPDVEEDNENNDDAHENYDVSNKSDDNDNPNNEENNISTLVNPLSSTTVNQMIE